MEIAKHLMRYQQFFGSKAIAHKAEALLEKDNASAEEYCFIDESLDHDLALVADLPQHNNHRPREKRQARGGVIWHTQGSGKTELAWHAGGVYEKHSEHQ